MDTKIGIRIKEKREKLGYTQKGLAEIINVGRVTINQWENGTRTPHIEIMPELSKALKCTIKYLITGSMDYDIPENTLIIANEDMIEYQSLKINKLKKEQESLKTIENVSIK